MSATLTRVEPLSLGPLNALLNALMRAVCERRGHHWLLYGQPLGREGEWNLPFGRREYCTRCMSNRVTLKDGFTMEATKAELAAAEPRFAETLYEARWGERPKQALWRGEWPAP